MMQQLWLIFSSFFPFYQTCLSFIALITCLGFFKASVLNYDSFLSHKATQKLHIFIFFILGFVFRNRSYLCLT